MQEHHKEWRVEGKMLQFARRSRRRKTMVPNRKNSKRSETTVTLATKEATMIQRCKTSKSHHDNNVVDSRNRTHHTLGVTTEQTSNTIGREETTAK
jgi:hypothetical protein